MKSVHPPRRRRGRTRSRTGPVGWFWATSARPRGPFAAPRGGAHTAPSASTADAIDPFRDGRQTRRFERLPSASRLQALRPDAKDSAHDERGAIGGDRHSVGNATAVGHNRASPAVVADGDDPRPGADHEVDPWLMSKWGELRRRSTGVHDQFVSPVRIRPVISTWGTREADPAERVRFEPLETRLARHHMVAVGQPVEAEGERRRSSGDVPRAVEINRETPPATQSEHQKRRSCQRADSPMARSVMKGGDSERMDQLRKMKHQPGMPVTVVVRRPRWGPVLDAWRKRRGCGSAGQRGRVSSLPCAKSKSEIAERAPKAIAALAGGGVLWMAYPRSRRRSIDSDFSRDDGWAGSSSTSLRDRASDRHRRRLVGAAVPQVEDIADGPGPGAGAVSRGPAARPSCGWAGVPRHRSRGSGRPMVEAVDDVSAGRRPSSSRRSGKGSATARTTTGTPAAARATVSRGCGQPEAVRQPVTSRAVVDGEYLAEANAGPSRQGVGGEEMHPLQAAGRPHLDVVAELVRQQPT